MNQTMSVVRSLQSVEPAILEESIRVALLSLVYEVLKPEQHYAIVELLRNRDAFVSLPMYTGYSKSLSYQVVPVCAMKIILQIPGLVYDNVFCPLTVVLSPLVSLPHARLSKALDREDNFVHVSIQRCTREPEPVYHGRKIQHHPPSPVWSNSLNNANGWSCCCPALLRRTLLQWL